MRIYNQTDIPDKLMKRILSSAAQFIGVSREGHKDLIFRVVHGRYTANHGKHSSCCSVRLGWLKGTKSDRWKSCHGCIEMVIAMKNIPHWSDPLFIARHIWELAVHELAHHADFIEGKMRELWKGSYEGVAHDKHPVEISVYDRLYDKGIYDHHRDWSAQIIFPKRAQDAILDLASWYEENKQEKNS